jgi:hypothetical protein
MIEPIVIIHVRFAHSRTRRVIVRPTANMNIQGGMTFRLTGPHSRLKERHEETRGKERREGQKAKQRKRRTAAGPLNPFSRLVNGRGCLWVRERPAIVNGDVWLIATLRRSWGGNALDGNLNTMKSPVVALNIKKSQ